MDDGDAACLATLRCIHNNQCKAWSDVAYCIWLCLFVLLPARRRE